MRDLYQNIALLLLRLGFGGGIALFHGYAKIANFSTMSSTFPDPIGLGPVISLGLATFAEFFCALLVATGIATRWAVLPLIINMSVAVIIVHKHDPFAKRELAILYLCAFIVIALLGPGKYALQKR